MEALTLKSQDSKEKQWPYHLPQNDFRRAPVQCHKCHQWEYWGNGFCRNCGQIGRPRQFRRNSSHHTQFQGTTNSSNVGLHSTAAAATSVIGDGGTGSVPWWVQGPASEQQGSADLGQEPEQPLHTNWDISESAALNNSTRDAPPHAGFDAPNHPPTDAREIVQSDSDSVVEDGHWRGQAASTNQWAWEENKSGWTSSENNGWTW